MKTKIFLLYFVIMCILTACAKPDSYDGINTASHINEIGNLKYGLISADNEYLYFLAGRRGNIYKMNIETGKVTFLCDDPTCNHTLDCPSVCKTSLQTDGKRLFAQGNHEIENGSEIVYASFGEIKDGKYIKILEKNTGILLPTITDGRLLCCIDNKISLIDLNTKKTIKEFEYDYALSLLELYCVDNTIYFVNGLGLFNSIDIETGEKQQLINTKVRKTLVCGEDIYYIDDKNLLFRRKKDKTMELITENCQTFNIVDNTLYVSYTVDMGVFTMDLDGRNKNKIFDKDIVLYIQLFKEQNMMVCSNYENFYIGKLNGTEMIEPEVPEPIDYDIDVY